MSLITYASPRGCPLSEQQFTLLTMVAEGRTIQQAAMDTGITYSTAKSQLSSAYGKLEVLTAAQAVIVMHKSGWLDFIDTEWQDDRVTAAQHLYLRAFERCTRARSRAATGFAIQERLHHFKSMCMERGTPMRSKRRQARGLAALLQDMDS